MSRPSVGLNERHFVGSYNSSSARPGGAFYFHHFPHRPFGRYPSSGCFFNGSTQVCFFVPLFAFCGFGNVLYFDSEFDGAWTDSGDASGDNSDQSAQAQLDVVPPSNGSSDYGRADGEPSDAAADSAGAAIGKAEFMLVLKNGVRYAVTDYWVSDGYLEYTISDGTRSQVPLDSLDLESTVAENAPRGLPFVLRSAPGQGR